MACVFGQPSNEEKKIELSDFNVRIFKLFTKENIYLFKEKSIFYVIIGELLFIYKYADKNTCMTTMKQRVLKKKHGQNSVYSMR